MRAEGGSRSTTRPWSSTGTPTTFAPRAPNRRRTGTYPGSSTATQSPGSSKIRATRSTACWVPEVTTTVSSPAATDRDRATQPAMARRSLIRPAGSPYSRCSAATAAATRRRHIAAGNSEGSGMPGRRSNRQPYGGGRKYGDQPANRGLGRRAASAPASTAPPAPAPAAPPAPAPAAPPAPAPAGPLVPVPAGPLVPVPAGPLVPVPAGPLVPAGALAPAATGGAG